MCVYLAGTLGSPPTSNTNLVHAICHLAMLIPHIYGFLCRYALIYFPNPDSVFRSYIVHKVFLENVIRDAVTYTEHAKKKT